MARGGKRLGAGRKPKDKQSETQPLRLPWRPSKYDASFCDRVIEAMAEGYSLTGFAGRIGVCRSTLNGWMAEYPDFLKACNAAKAVRTSFWEAQAVRVAKMGGGPGTAQIIQFSLKNTAPDEYSDTQNLRHAGPDGQPMPAEKTVIILPSNSREITT